MQKIKDGSHIPEDILEEVALGRLPQRDIPEVFEHLLDCEDCNERYEQQLAFRRNLEAATALNIHQAASGPKRSLLSGLLSPGPAWAAAAALAIVVVFVPTFLSTPAPSSVQTVDLTAMRGAQEVAARAGSELELRLDTSGVHEGSPMRIQIVNASGAEMWAGTAKSTDGRWIVRPDRTLAAGQYWVRVYDSNGTADPVREFSLNLR